MWKILGAHGKSWEHIYTMWNRMEQEAEHDVFLYAFMVCLAVGFH